jgi:hypothetical protein
MFIKNHVSQSSNLKNQASYSIQQHYLQAEYQVIGGNNMVKAINGMIETRNFSFTCLPRPLPSEAPSIIPGRSSN